MEIAQLLIPNLLLSASLFVLLWVVNLQIKDPSFIDSWWPIGMVVLAWLSLVSTGQGGRHALLLTGLCTLWGVRLGVYLFWRWRTHGPDHRYSTMMATARSERGWGYGKASLLLVFALQMPLQFVVALPVQLGHIGPDRAFGPLAYAGAALCLIGVAFEAVGDHQLARFKSDPVNQGKVLSRGLWRYTRHPNYFGDACAWWGLYLIAADHGLGVWSLPAPLLLTFLLVRWSGVPTVEGRMRRERPDYEAYVARTSGFIPWFPRKPSSERR